MKRTRLALATCLAVVLTACGGPSASREAPAAPAETRSVGSVEAAAAPSAFDRQAYVLLLTDADMRVRQDAVDTLADLGTDEVIELLQMALYDPHPAVRQAAAEGLAELGM